MELWQRIICSFGKPINRVGFLVFVLGVFAFFVAVIWYFNTGSSYYRSFENFFDYVFDFDGHASYRDEWKVLARIALLAMIWGGLAAWLYESTIGRAVHWWRQLVLWIRSGGQAHKEPDSDSELGEALTEESLAKRDPLPIGGWLWFPALWTVTNPVIGLMVIESLGVVPLLLSIPNAILFWMKSRFYPIFFMAQTCLLLWVMDASHIAPGSGFAFAIIAAIALFISRRAKGTFIK